MYLPSRLKTYFGRNHFSRRDQSSEVIKT